MSQPKTPEERSEAIIEVMIDKNAFPDFNRAGEAAFRSLLVRHIREAEQAMKERCAEACRGALSDTSDDDPHNALGWAAKDILALD